MARVHRSVFAARERGRSRLPVKTLDDGRKVLPCSGPGPTHYIEKGQPYLWFAPGFRAYPTVRCPQHPPRPSELDGSLMSSVLAAQEAAADTLASLDVTQDADGITSDVQAVIDDVRSAVEDVAQQYEDADEAMGGHQGEKYEWAANLRGAEVMSWDANDYDSFEPDSNACQDHDGDPDDDCDDCTSSIADAREEWARGLVDEASDKINDISRD